MRRCGLIEITCPSGPKGGTRPSPSGDAIMFGPKAQKGVGVFLARTIYIYIYIVGTRFTPQPKWMDNGPMSPKH